MKHKFWAVIIAVLILTPSVVAIANYFSTKDSPVNKSSVSRLAMTDLDGTEFTFEKSSDELDLSNISTNMIRFFTDINEKATPEAELPEPLRGTEYYKVIYNNYGRDVEYKYYFTEKPGTCYYTDADGKCFLIPADYAAAFLNSLYGKSVFSTATLPIMTTPSGEIIAPLNLKWSYLAVNDIYPTYTASDASAFTDTVYNIPESLAVSFSIPAGAVNVSVSRGEEELYNGLYENLSYAQIPANEELAVEVSAKWYKTEDRQSEGEAEYKFKCKITDKPVFYLASNSDTVLRGDFVTVTVKNTMCSPEQITFRSEPDIGYTPTFYVDGNYKRALIPLSLDLAPGNYSFIFGADGTEQTVEFTLNSKDYGSKTENINSDVLTEQTLSAYDEAMKQVYKEKSSQRYFDGEFIYPVSQSVVSSGFGRSCTTAQGFTYLNKWVRVIAGNGTDVLAMNKGKVIYVGEQTMTGKVVVVDHGLGLKSTYANLTSVSVSVGDTVSTSDKIGVYGASGYSDGTTMSVALTIDDVYVCPYEIWDAQGIVFSEK